MTNRKASLVVALALSPLPFAPAQSQEAPYLAMQSVQVDNDAILSDRGYTSGLRYASLVTAGPAWRTRVETRKSTRILLLGIRPCPPGGRAVDRGCHALRAGRAFGHAVYTPEALSVASAIPDDRPYGGYVYYGWLFEAARDRWTHEIEYDVGVMGPVALGEPIQKAWHSIGDWTTPRGWDNQIPNAPAASARVRSQYLLFGRGEREGPQGIGTRSLDVTPFAEAVVGTPIANVSGGVTLRVGRNLGTVRRRLAPITASAGVLDGQIDSVLAMPAGVERRKREQEVARAIRQSARRGRDLPPPLYLFATARAVAVGHNAFLEGPLVGLGGLSLRPSSAVSPPMRRSYGEVEIGAVFRLPHPLPPDVALRLVSRGPEFEGDRTFRFLAVTVTW